MANGILIVGDTGSGKSTSLVGNEKVGIEGLNPSETFLIFSSICYILFLYLHINVFLYEESND